MAHDNARNAQIVSFLCSAHRKERTTIVFSSIIDHLREIERLLLEQGIPQTDIGYYVGAQNYEGNATQKAVQREKSKKCAIILATYSMASEATDIPWLDCAVLGTPRADVVQIVGRIRREYEGKKFPVVFDLVDSASPVFKAYASKRMSWYRSLGVEVKWV
jgi:superfamily II DNA or RNA helicase